jgi:hypothetical protein
MTLNKVGSAGTAYDDPKYYVGEVAPPGWGHTKAKKEKTNPEKPKSKIGGSASAFKKALDDGRFKGLPGDKTKKEKTASMFKLMWSMKKKGAKPHYKPGTDKKYEKYQDEGVTYEYKGKKYKKLPDGVKTLPGWGTDGREDLGKLKDAITDKLGITNTKKKGVLAKEESEMPNVSDKDKGAIKKRFKGLFKKDIKGTVAGVNELFDIDPKSHKKAQKKAKMRNLAKGNTNPNEKAAAEKKAGGPKLAGEDWKPEIEHVKGSDLRKKAAEKKRKAAADSLPPHLRLDVMKKAFANEENVSGISLEPYTPDIKFREYEFIDIIKPEPLKGTVSEATGCSDDYENLKKKVGSKKKHDKPAITFKEFKDINSYT